MTSLDPADRPRPKPTVQVPPSDAVRSLEDVYAPDDERPLAAFAGIMAAYGATVGGLSLLVRATGRRLPERLAPGDVAATAVATYRVARVVAKSPVTSPLRAPFTRFRGVCGEAELDEEVRGTGWRKAMGELVSCPFCLGQWVVTGFGFGWIFAPRATRMVASMLSAAAVADTLHYGHAALERTLG
jgi:hypothetical protein